MSDGESSVVSHTYFSLVIVEPGVLAPVERLLIYFHIALYFINHLSVMSSWRVKSLWMAR